MKFFTIEHKFFTDWLSLLCCCDKYNLVLTKCVLYNFSLLLWSVLNIQLSPLNAVILFASWKAIIRPSFDLFWKWFYHYIFMFFLLILTVTSHYEFFHQLLQSATLSSCDWKSQILHQWLLVRRLPQFLISLHPPRKLFKNTVFHTMSQSSSLTPSKILCAL